MTTNAAHGARRLVLRIAVAALALATARGHAASYSFDEDEWTGAAGEVLEAGGVLNGTAVGGAVNDDATPALAGDPGSCRYGVFDGSNYVEVADNAALDISAQLTVGAWVRLDSTPGDLYTIASKDTNYEYHVNSARRVYWWWNDSANNARSITTATALNLNQWYHVAITYQSGAQAIYIDGTLSASSAYAGTLATNNLPFFVATDWNFPSRNFDGFVDEVRVLPTALTQPQIAALRAETHPCPSAAAQFTINHDGVGINCVAERVTVDVIDSNAGTPLLGYNAQVRLDTQTGRGTWTRVSGSGAFADGAADDGVATYSWPLGESQAAFDLSYPAGPAAMDVDVEQVTDTGIRDTDAEGALVFSPNGFTVTAAALANPPGAIASFTTSQTAGEAFALHIAAYGQTPGDPACGIIEEYTGAKALKFWSQYSNPATGTRNITIDGVGAAAAEAAAAPQTVTFANGQAAVIAKYKDVGRIQIALKDDTLVDADELPQGIAGATAAFVVRPADFVLSGIANGAGAPPLAVDADGPRFVAAGAPFRATVTVVDADGDATPNYGQETPAEGVRLITSLVAPLGGANPAIGTVVGFGAFAAGAATGTDFTWLEVGVIELRAGVGDFDYLVAGDVVGDSTSAPVGRFVPDHFTASLNAPEFEPACAAGAFTYQGERFVYSAVPVITLTARAADLSESVTTNYAGDFFKLATGTLQNRSYTSAGGSLSTTGLPLPADDPVVAPLGGGVATLTFSSGTGVNPGLSFDKGAPQGPFPAGIRLSIDVLDADAVAAAANPVTFGDPDGIAFSAAPGGMPRDEIRWGRIRVANANGSELVDLPVTMLAEHYAGAGQGFVPNFADVCTANVSMTLGGYTKNLADGETCVRDAGAPGPSGAGCAAAAPLPQRFESPPDAVLTPGNFNLRLAAPGAGNNGSLTVGAQVPDWLKFDWNALLSGDENPSGQAVFGVYGGEQKQIYTREIY